MVLAASITFGLPKFAGLAGALGGADQRPAPSAPGQNQRPTPRAPERPRSRPRLTIPN